MKLVINDSNYRDFLAPVVDGQRKGMGLVKRDLDKFPPQIKNVREIKVIPREEWPERIAELKAKKARLSDIRKSALNGKPIPSLDQGNKGYCHTEDTEVLTDKGWVFWPEYNGIDQLATVNPYNHLMEYQHPVDRQVFDYSGKMFYVDNQNLNFGVTPNHRMYVRKWDQSERALSDSYSFVTAENLGWYSGLLDSPSGHLGVDIKSLEVPGDRIYSGNDFAALLGLIVSDGYAGGTDNTKNWVSFASFKDHRREEVKALADRIGFKECPSRPGVFIRYEAGALANWIRSHCYSGSELGALNKKVPQIIKDMSNRQIETFLKFFDDANDDRTIFYSSSKGLIDDIQEILFKLGKRSSFHKVPAKSVEFNGKKINGKEAYVLTIQKRSQSIDKNKYLEEESYNGRVYCATVPNSTLITRRKGKTLISGNCWTHSVTHGLIINRAKANMPYVPLSAYSVACKIKNFRDEGGWGALALEFIEKNGIMPQSLWPQGSMARTNDRPENWKVAQDYRVTDSWADLTRSIYDRTITFDQTMSLLLAGTPVVLDLYWWGHSVLGLDPLEVNPRLPLSSIDRWGINIWNSWGDDWSELGEGELHGSKAVPDGAVAPLTLMGA